MNRPESKEPTRPRVRVYVIVEVEQMGPIGVSYSALEAALRHKIRGSAAVGGMLWAAAEGVSQTGYRVISVSGTKVPDRSDSNATASA